MTSWKTAGIVSARQARISIVACELAALRLNDWRSRARPPTSIEPPSTSSTLPSTEPMIDALTTSWSPSRRAKNAISSSGKLPNVTLSRPPMPGPARSASSSVAVPISAAVGITPIADDEEDQRRARVHQLEHDRQRDERHAAGTASRPR